MLTISILIIHFSFSFSSSQFHELSSSFVIVQLLSYSLFNCHPHPHLLPLSFFPLLSLFIFIFIPHLVQRTRQYRTRQRSKKEKKERKKDEYAKYHKLFSHLKQQKQKLSNQLIYSSIYLILYSYHPKNQDRNEKYNSTFETTK